MAAKDIANRAAHCIDLLSNTISIPATTQGQRDWADDQRARLNLWADSLGVFASQEHFSITRRLQNNVQVARVVSQLLAALATNIKLYTCALTNETWKPDPGDSSDDETSSTDTSSASSSEGRLATPDADKQVRRIHDEIGRLVRLAIRLRREGAEKSELRAADFEPADLANFRSFVAAICRRTFDYNRTNSDDPGFLVADFLKERTQATILSRWRRISYLRHHASNLAPGKSRLTGKVDQLKPKQSVHVEQIHTRDAKRVDTTDQTTVNPLAKTSARKAGSAATSVRADLKINKKVDLEKSSVGTASTKVRANQLNFPAVPKVRDGAEEFICPLCGFLQSSKLLTKRKWRDHVLQDLAPYFCLDEYCEQSLKMFQSLEQWQKHMKEDHSELSWICQECRSTQSTAAPGVFESSATFTEHVKAVHSPAIGERELALILRINCHKSQYAFKQCGFCGFVPDMAYSDASKASFYAEILAHVAEQHLQHFALLSLPWDIAGSNDGGSDAVTHTSKTSTVYEDIKRRIMQDPELTKYDLTALEESRLREDPSLSRYLDSTVNRQSANLEEIKRSFTTILPFDEVCTAWCRSLSAESIPELDSAKDVPTDLDEDDIGHLKPESQPDPQVISNLARYSAAPGVGKESARIHIDSIKAILASVYADFPAIMDSLSTFDPLTVMDAVSATFANEAELLHQFNRFLPDGYHMQRMSEANTHQTRLTAPGGFVDVDEKDRINQRSFFQLAIEGRKDRMDSFIRVGFDIQCRDLDGFSVLHRIALAGTTDCIAALAEAGFDMDADHDTYGTPLTLAIARQDLGVTASLVNHGADVNAGSAKLGSPLHVACAAGDAAVAHILLDNGARHDSSREVDFRSLAQAYDLSSESTMKSEAGLQKQIANSERVSQSIYECVKGQPLAVAACFGNAEIVRILIDQEVAIDEPFNWTEMIPELDESTHSGANATALFLATATNPESADVARLLLDHGANIDHLDGDRHSAAQWAAYAGNLAVLTELTERGAAMDATRTANGSPLHAAMRWGSHVECVRFLAGRGLPLDQPDDQQETPLSLASRDGDLQVLEILVQHGADLNSRGPERCTALMKACVPKDPSCLHKLLQHGADVLLSDAVGDTALSWAAAMGAFEHTRLLLEHGANVETVNVNGDSPLGLGASCPDDHSDLVELLCKAGAALDSHNNEGNTPLLLAILNGNRACAHELIMAGADVNARNASDQTAVFLASRCNQPTVLEHLLQKHAAIDEPNDRSDMALTIAVQRGHVECLQILIEAGSSLKVSDNEWRRALLLAAEEGNVACLRKLLTKAPPDAKNEYDDRTAMMLASARGHRECVRVLLDASSPIDAEDCYGDTALHFAVRSGSVACVRLLLEAGASHSIQNSVHRTPLDTVQEISRLNTSASESMRQCTKLLVEHGADVNCIDGGGRTPLHQAVRYNLVAEMRILIDAGALVDITDSEGQSALMYCAQWGYINELRLLLEAGASLKLQNATNGFTALIYALIEVNTDAVAALLNHGSTLTDVLGSIDSNCLLSLRSSLQEIDIEVVAPELLEEMRSIRMQVAIRSSELVIARDPVLVLKPWQKHRLGDVLQRIRDRRRKPRLGPKKVSFAATWTPQDNNITTMAQHARLSRVDESSDSERIAEWADLEVSRALHTADTRGDTEREVPDIVVGEHADAG